MDPHIHPVDSADAWDGADLTPGPGAGTLARRGRVVLLVGSQDPARVHPLLEQAELVAANGGQGRQLVRGFALQLSTSTEDHPSFVAMAPHDTGLAVFLQGDTASVMVNGERISGADSLAWVERLVPWPIHQLEASVDPSASVSGGLYRLTDGVVPAGGFAISGAHAHDVPVMAVEAPPQPEAKHAAVPPTPAEPVQAAPPPPPPPAPTPAPPPPAPEPVAAAPAPVPDRPTPAMPEDDTGHFDSILLSDVQEDAPQPLPIVSEVKDVSQVADPAVQVEEVRGVYCKNRHFNDPRQLFCAVCGINMVQQTPVLVNGTRPPLGVIVLDDGSVFQLDSDYLLGRDPASDERVRSEAVRGIPVQDQSNQISRVHARIELRGWDPVLIDNQSTNGTFVNPPKTADWHRLPSGGEHVLTQGTRVRIGHRTLAFNTHAGQ
ncbi:MAG TPA: FHA domain-containing protein [Nocardioides sp.]|nr:FHA domain-containing protein [Nocardioides sp.]